MVGEAGLSANWNVLNIKELEQITTTTERLNEQNNSYARALQTDKNAK